ncbi:MAG: endo-1,4-beta-xylanase [Verrucomicrobiota bacterium]
MNRHKSKWLAAASVFLAWTVSAQTTLKDAFEDDFLIGAALKSSQFTEKNQKQSALVKAQFNTLSPENDLKWSLIHPAPDHYAFAAADRYVAFGETNRMVIIGHTLVWHQQTPAWVFQGANGQPATREELLARMKEHISTVVGRYRGRIHGWDVVNEAVAEDGSLRQSPWLKIIGEEYLIKAYQFAHEADPAAELYYNDYNLEQPAKRAGALKLIQKLQAAGVKITAVGLQSHHRLDAPSAEQVEQTIAEFSNLGIQVNITELDVDVLPSPRKSLSADVSLNYKAEDRFNPYVQGLPAEVQAKLAARYAELFRIYLRHRDAITRVTFWNVTDAESWLNNFPVRGRTNHPLLFDRQGQPKPAFEAVMREAAAARPKNQ